MSNLPYEPPQGAHQPPQGQPYPQQGYGQPPYGQPYGQMPGGGYGYSGPPVPTYKGWSIANMVLGFIFGMLGLVLGAIALTKASKIEMAQSQGNLALAHQESNSARTLNIIGTILVVLGGIFTIIYIASLSS